LLFQVRGKFVIYSVESKTQVPGVHRFKWESSQPVELKGHESWYRLGCEITTVTCKTAWSYDNSTYDVFSY